MVSLIASACLLSACAGPNTKINGDYATVVESSLSFIERNSPVVAFVVSSSINSNARAALAAKRKIVLSNAVPQTAQFDLPEGYFVVKDFTVTGDTANFSGKLGPIWHVTGPRDFGGCGANFTLPFVRTNGVLNSTTYHLVQC
jgi:hypothetical protein